METELRFTASNSSGEVSAVLVRPDTAQCLLVFGHGAGAGMQAYADEAEGWRAAGARIIGGCCGTTPEHISELRRRWR